MSESLLFAQRLLARGIELVLRTNGRLHVWPGRAYQYLSDSDKAFIRAHRDELAAQVRARVLPETSVTWERPNETTAHQPATATPPPAEVSCPYCNRAPCVGPASRWFAVLHGRDPSEVARRDAEATAVMLRRRTSY